ncbi:hypothetical protein [Elongatibacter sediminis]|uniref:Secreted protein n=1 Tax=Elongatibacter sediminis TaxID=3119006 RepID=A0AAW9RLC2_9GAMM
MNRLFLAMILLAMAAPSPAQQAFSSLEEQMTGKEFTAAGLEKLSPQELEALNRWIRGRSLATLDASRAPTTPGDSRGFENQQIQNMDRTTITSRLVGTFTGWDGETVFELENGMIWEQSDKDKFYIREIENPVVTIEPGAFRTWRLSVEGYSSECRVERIQ